MNEEPGCTRSAQPAGSRVPLVDLLVDEGPALRRDAVDRAWIDWLTDSIPGIGPPKTVRDVGIWEEIPATASVPIVLSRAVTESTRGSNGDNVHGR